MSIRCCGGSTATPSRARRSGTPRSAATADGCVGCPRWSPRSAPTRRRRSSRPPGYVAATLAPPVALHPWCARRSLPRGPAVPLAGFWSALTRRSAPMSWSRRVVRLGRTFSLTLQSNGKLRAAIDGIAAAAWATVRYPGAVYDEQTGCWSEAEVPKRSTRYSKSGSHKVTARLVVRRVKERNAAPAGQEETFPLWRCHAFLTDTDLSTVDSDRTQRGHAIVEQVFADLIDGPLAHLPRRPVHRQRRLAEPGRDRPQPATCRRLPDQPPLHHRTNCHHPPAPDQHPSPAGPPSRRLILHLPTHWPWQQPWQTLSTASTPHPSQPDPRSTAHPGPTGACRCARRINHTHHTNIHHHRSTSQDGGQHQDRRCIQA